LGLSNNCLTELPTQLGQLARLQALDLAGNDLKELPATWASLRTFRSLTSGAIS
jgi:Leucine-rich repeat (LRR) protein